MRSLKRSPYREPARAASDPYMAAWATLRMRKRVSTAFFVGAF